MHPLLEKNLISTKEASELSGYNSDYLARLCKSDRIRGRQIGRTWLVDKTSLEVFIKAQGERKVDRARALARAREYEYRTAQPPTEVVKEPRITRSEHITLLPESMPTLRLARTSGVLAALLAVLVLGVSAYAAESGTIPAIANAVGTTLADVRIGFTPIASAQLAAIQNKLDAARSVASNAGVNARASIPRTIAIAPTIAPLAFRDSTLALAPMPHADRPALAFAPTRNVLSPALQPINVSTLARDMFFGLINAPHAAIALEVRAVYAVPSVATLTSRVAFNAVSNIGTTLAVLTSRTPRTAIALAKTTQSSAIALGEGAARAFYGAEYALAERFVALAGSTETLEMDALRSSGALAYQSYEGVVALAAPAQSGIASLARIAGAPLAYAQNVVLGTLGRGALAFENIFPTQGVVSVATAIAAQTPALSTGQNAALTTYTTLHGLFDSTTNKISLLFRPLPIVVLPNAPAPVARVATTTRSTSQLVVSGPTYRTYSTTLQGVSQSTLEQSLASLKSDLLTQIGAITAPIAYQGAVNQTSIQQVNMIQSLSDLILHRPVIDGAQITTSNFSGSSVSATTGTFTTLTAGTSTFAGPVDATGFTVNGVPVSGVGTVTSVDASGGTTGLSFTGGPIIGSGVLTLAGNLAIANGGTGTTTAPTYGKLLIGNASGTYDLVATSSLGIAGSGGGTWGSITGTLSNQTDLQNALNSKLDLTAWYATTTDGLAQGLVNKYWSNMLFDNRLSATTSLPNLITLAGLSLPLSQTTGILPISRGGSGTSTAPTYGQLLVGDANGNYELMATSSLGIVSGGGTVTSVSGTYPIISSGGSTPTISLAFGTSTSNTWGGTQTFTSNPILGALSGLIYGNSGTLAAAATTTFTPSGEFSTTGTLGTFVGGTNSTLALATNQTALSKLVQVAANTILGNFTGATGNITAFATSTLGIALSDTSGTLGATSGGTGVTSYNTGDILYADSPNHLTTLAVAANGTVLKLAGGVPSWGVDLTSGGGGVGGTWATTTSNVAGRLINYPINATDIVAIGATATTSAPYWFDPNTLTSFLTGNVGIGSSSPSFPLSVRGNSYFGGDIRNVANITATGTISAATLSLTNALTVANGGTGVSTFTSSQLLYGNGTNALSSVATTTFTPGAEFTTTGTLGALIGGSNSTLALATNQTALSKLVQIAANSILGNNTGATGNVTAFATSTLGIALSDTTGTLGVSRGGTGVATFSSSQLVYGNGTNALTSVATSSFAITSSLGLSYTGTLGALVGGTGGILSIATSSLYSGATGQFPYFSAANTITATSSLFLATSGNVGVGSTTPWARLSVSSAAQTSAITPLFAVGSTTNTSLFTILGNGNVGIGATTTPTSVLSIVGPSSTGSFNALDALTVVGGNGFGSASVNGTKGSNISLTAGNGGSVTGVHSSGLGGDITLTTGNGGNSPTNISNEGGNFTVQTGTGGTTNSNGNTSGQGGGIGLTTGNGADAYGINSAAGSAGTLAFTAGNGGNATSSGAFGGAGGTFSFTGGNGGIGPTSNVFSPGGGFTFVAGNGGLGSNGGAFGAFGGNGSTTGSGGSITFDGGLGGSSGIHGNVLLATSRGVVGIGSTTPYAQLSVGPNSATAGQQAASFPLFTVGSSTNATLFTVLGGGSVGIGTTSPGSLLSIGGAGTGWNFYDNATTTKNGVGGVNITQGCFAVNGVCVGSSAAGVTSIQQLGGGSAQTGAITFATSSQTTNGLTTGLNITNSSGAFTFAPTISGTLTVAGGGTGVGTFTSSQLLYGNGTNSLSSVATTTFTPGAEFSTTGTLGALIGGSNSTLALATNQVALSKLVQVAANTILGNNTGATGNVVAFATSTLGIALGDTTGTLLVTRGGTGLSAVADGSLIFGSGGTALIALASSTGGFLSNSYATGRPVWSATSTLNVAISDTTGTLTVARGGTGQTTFAADQLHYGNFSTVATTTFTPSAEFTVGGTIGALVGGANSTLTLATNGVALTKIAQIAANSILGNFTSATGNVVAFATSTLGIALGDTTGTLLVTRGGTGLSAVADGSLIFGSGGTALTALASSTGGFLTNSYTTGRPAWAATSTLNVALADTTGTLSVARGGTGIATFSSSQLVYGNGTAALSSVATTTQSFSGPFTISGTLGALVGGSNSTITYTGLATTSAISSGQVLYGTSASGVASVATSSIASGTNITVTNGSTAFVLGAQPTISLSGTIAYGNGGTGSTTAPLGQLLYGGSSAYQSVATTSATLGLGLSYSGTLGALVGGASGSLTIATSSLYSGSTGQFPYFSASNTITATSSIFLSANGSFGIGSTTPGSLLSIGGTGTGWNFYDNATSTKSGVGGINILQGCFAVNGTCVGGGSFSNTIANGGTATTTFYGGGVLFYNSSLGTLSQASAQTGLYFDNPNQRLGIGTTTPVGALGIQTLTNQANAFSLANSIGSTTLSADTIDTAGNIFSVATTSGSDYFDVQATGNIAFGTLVYTSCTGLTTNGSGVIQCSVSDQRLKQDITTLDDSAGLSAIRALNPVSFTYIDPSRPQGLQYGVIAQQVQQVLPNLVATSSPTYLTPGGTLTVNYEGLIAPLIRAVQELDVRTASLGTGTSTSASSTTPVSPIIISGSNVGINVMPASARLQIAGNVLADEYDAPLTSGSTFTFGSSTLTAIVPPSVLTVGGAVDLYKLATYNLSGITLLASLMQADEMRITSLEDRVAALESGAVGAATSTNPFSTSTLASAFNAFGAYIAQGIAQFGTLVADQFVAATNSAGTSSAGSGTVLSGNTTVVVTNAYLHASSKIFVTFTSTVAGGWYLSDKQEGSFRLTLPAAAASDTSFDYFIVQSAGQIATSTAPVVIPPPPPPPDDGGNSGAPPPDASSTPPTPPSTTAPPTVTLNGSAAMQINQGDTFTDPGASALDYTGADISSSIVETGLVDAATAGSYTLTYTATDSVGQTGSASRLVNVVAVPPPPTPPADDDGDSGGDASSTPPAG